MKMQLKFQPLLLYRVIMDLKDQMVHVDPMAIQEPKVPMELMEKMVTQDLLVHQVTQDIVTINMENQDLLVNLENLDRRYIAMTFCIYIAHANFCTE